MTVTQALSNGCNGQRSGWEFSANALCCSPRTQSCLVVCDCSWQLGHYYIGRFYSMLSVTTPKWLLKELFSLIVNCFIIWEALNSSSSSLSTGAEQVITPRVWGANAGYVLCMF